MKENTKSPTKDKRLRYPTQAADEAIDALLNPASNRKEFQSFPVVLLFLGWYVEGEDNRKGVMDACLGRYRD